MNPKIPGLLSRLIEAAEKTLDRPSGDPRRIEQIEKLHDEVCCVAGRVAQHSEPLVNDWSLMLVKMLRKIERMGPFGEADELARATTVGLALMPHIKADFAAALEAAAAAAAAPARAETSDQDYQKRTSSQ